MSLANRRSGKKRLLLFSICFLILLLAFLSILRIRQLNRRYPDPEIVTHHMMEEIAGGDISLTFIDYQLLSGAEFRELYPDYQDNILNRDMTPVRDEQRYVLLATVQVHNYADEEKAVSLTQINAESLSWANGIDGNIYPLMNTRSQTPMRIDLQPKEEQTIVLPYSLYEFQFQAKDWATVKNRSYDLTLSFYPVRNIVLLQEGQVE